MVTFHISSYNFAFLSFYFILSIVNYVYLHSDTTRMMIIKINYFKI